MENACLKAVILHILNQLNGERTIYSVLHLLKGKKSSQTIQDAHFFNTAPFFQIYARITRIELEKEIGMLAGSEWIEKVMDSRYRVTQKGKEHLDAERDHFPAYVNGWAYHHLTGPFWERLSLLVQVTSNLIHHESKYVPVQGKTEILFWLKNFLDRRAENRRELSRQLYDELVHCLGSNSNFDPAFLVLRLTGYQDIGMTDRQAAEKMRVDHSCYHLRFLNILHYMIQTITSNQNQYPLLKELVMDTDRKVQLTLSTRKTFDLLKQGCSIERIAGIRNLKISTIEDHVVEISLNVNNFDISPYVGIEKQQKVLQAARRTSVKQLKEIREQAGDANYFEIRLVLAKFGGRSWN